MERTMITAHSGCDGTPDNSPEFIAHALTCGADDFEVDVRSRPDGTLYLSHDEGGGDALSLDRVFAGMAGSSMRVNCDLKQPGIELAVLALARARGVADRLLFSGSVSMELMAREPEIRSRTLLNVRPILPDPARTEADLDAELDRLLLVCRQCGASVINVPYGMCTGPVLDRLEEAGIGVSAWTVNDEDTAARLLERRIRNITSRRPGMVLALRAALR